MFSVLHVEHSCFYNRIVQNIISNEEFKYICVKSPSDSYEVLEGSKINLIITGLEFENETGQDFIENLNKSKYKNIPVIVLSSNDDVEVKQRLVELGVVDFVNKNSFVDRLKGYINKYNSNDRTQEELKKIKIAVLDDSKFELNRIKRIFQLNNIINVDYYSDPEMLLNSKEIYSLYLVDYVLPKLSGEQVILELRSKLKYVLIIAISGTENDSTVSNILNSGADDYIMKPYSESIFMARIRANIRTFGLLKELERKKLELERIVQIDGLTNLYNHKSTFERMEEYVENCKNNGIKLSVVMFDIDNFKHINDTYGHQVGDEVLIKISDILKLHVRGTDIVGRYGGEEFVLILPETDLKGALFLCEKLRLIVQETNFGKENFKVTISGGVREMKTESALELIRMSDKLMYKAKNNGKNRIEFN